jgi:diguanylate cyclase (GGDEF)-like protein/putative nucleotidyltransferase with HDIG domain
MTDEVIHVLLVEDNPGDARLIEELLRERGNGSFHLERVDRLDAGLERLSEGDVGLVLLDLSLPDAQGLDTLASVLADAPAVPVIVLTGLDDEAVALDAVRQGAQDYLVKGKFDGGLLVRAARYAIERKQIEDELRSSKQRYQAIFDHTGIGIALISPQMRILSMNRQMSEWFPSIDPHGHPVCHRAYNDPPRDRPCEDCPVVETLQDGQVHEAVTETPAGDEIRNYRIVSTPLTDAEGRTTAVIEMVDDITDRQRAQEALAEANRRLEELATTDELTGLWNRRRFLEMLDHELRRARRGQADLTVALIDVDHFKGINDTRGHAFGDRVLEAVAEALQEGARDSDTVARFGGDEFAVLMPQTTVEDAQTPLSRIRQRVSATQISDGEDALQVTLSIGAAGWDHQQVRKADVLMRLADEALYAAKEDGRNTVRTWDQVRRQQKEEPPPEREAIERLERQVGDLSARSKEMFMQSIQGLVNALEARDIYSRNHSENVTQLAVGIATVMDLGQEQLETIRRAAMIHDIGKIGVPDVILRKPAGLSPSERRVMEQHVLIGTRILRQLQFLENEIPIVRHHHERWDGRGYPDCLAGDGIPLGARIVAVADALDAMTSERVYRPAHRLHDALRILVEGAGTQFDPKAVDAALQWALQARRKADEGAELTPADLREAKAEPAAEETALAVG